MNPDCHFGDHLWRGSSQCVLCGARLRCNCGVYIREDNIDAHIKRCRYFAAVEQAEYDDLRRSIA